MFLTYKFRIKDSTSQRRLERMARSVNYVWNYCCETQKRATNRYRGGSNPAWITGFDFINLTSGVTKELGLHSDTIGQVCRRFAQSRDQFKKCPRFRASFGARRALGWVPFNSEGKSGRLDGDVFIFLKRRYRFWKTRDLPGRFKSGAFVQDARGRWYVTFVCEVADDLPTGSGAIGIDLGLKDLATCSDGAKIPAMQHYRRYEQALAVAQRGRNKKRVRAIHAKIANARRHQLHIESARLARENKIIVVGDVSPSKLAKTRMAKSVYDAGWTTFKTMLRYKASRHGATFIEADERYTTQACSRCGTIPDSSPKGIGALGMRRWDCSSCGASHDRDVNAAQNILRVGLECQPPVEEIAA